MKLYASYTYALWAVMLLYGPILYGQEHRMAPPLKSNPPAHSGESHQFCGSDVMFKQKIATDKNFQHTHDHSDQRIFQNTTFRRNNATNSKTTAELYTIPVVVHIIHSGGTENISDAQVLQGLQHLNDAFRRRVPYNGNGSADIEIEFCLAQQDPAGNFTTGINRINSPLTNLEIETQDLALKNLIRWDPRSYVNIWLVKEISSAGGGSEVAGYAYFASSHGTPEDGIVCEAQWFGSSTSNSKIHIHEFGHYLNLYHTFEGGCDNNNCMIEGDRVCDTPPDASTVAPFGCLHPQNTCVSDADDVSSNNPFRPKSKGGLGDQNDMLNNYMDYGNRVCMNAFTEGQKERMRLSLTEFRGSLLNSKGCVSACPVSVSASFTSSATDIMAGTSVSFTNTSTAGTTSSWSVNGVSLATTTDFNHTFNTQGVYNVKLTISNGDPSCTREFTTKIKVTCPAVADFTGNILAGVGSDVSFTNISQNANTYQWFLNGTATSSSLHYNHMFTVIGNYSIGLIAGNGTCQDTLYSVLKIKDTSSCDLGSKRGNLWYFGFNAGIDFNTDPPQPLVNSSMEAIEGCATMSDEEGELIMYSDGMTVWNKHHKVMPNGTGLLGTWSSTTVLIVPHPGNANLYYIFTVDDVGAGGINGLNYSLVDVSRNGGQGEVLSKNNLMITPSTEKITAVYHKNRSDIWLIGHKLNSNEFYVYSITSAGLNTTPDIQSIGTNYIGRGYLKISPDGSFLAAADEDLFIMETFRFNNSTGVISDPITIPIPNPGIEGPYGIEFSPDNSKVYLSVWFGGQKIYQHDISDYNTTSVLASQYVVATYINDDMIGAIQLAPDGKIYISFINMPTLDVIHSPNGLQAACNFESGAFLLGGRYANIGMPVFMTSFFQQATHNIRGPKRVCAGTNYTYTIEDLDNDTYAWSVIGNATIVSGQNTNSLSVSFSGNENVQLIVHGKSGCGFFNDTLQIAVESPASDFSLGNDTTVCGGSILDYSLILPPDYTSYLWQDGSGRNWMRVDTAGLYWVKVTNSCGQERSDSILIDLHPLDLELGDNSFMCSGGIVRVLHPGPDYVSYLWQDGSIDSTYTITREGMYWLRVVTVCGDTLRDTLRINMVNPIEVEVSVIDSLLSCSNQNIYLKAEVTNCLPDVYVPHYTPIEVIPSCFPQQFRWQLRNSKNEIAYSGGPYRIGLGDTIVMVDLPAGTYRFFAQDTGGDSWCGSSGGVIIGGFDQFIEFYILEDPFGSETEPLGYFTITEKGFNEPSPCSQLKYGWSPGEFSVDSITVKAGISNEYTVRIEDAYGCITTKTIALPHYQLDSCEIFIPNLITRNGDDQNDYFHIKGLAPNSSLELTNRWGQIIFSSENYQNDWNGHDQSDGMYFYILRSGYDDRMYKGWLQVISRE